MVLPMIACSSACRDRPPPNPAGTCGPAPSGPAPSAAAGAPCIYANPDEPNPKKRHILREDINPVEAEAIRDAATRVLDHGESVASIARDWTVRGIKPVAANNGGRPRSSAR